MSEMKSKQMGREWAAGWGGGLTGPTTPAVGAVVCGGRDWPFTPVRCGMETIAICPDQEGDPGSGERNATLFAAAPKLLAAVHLAHDLLAGVEGMSRNNIEQMAAEACETLAAAIVAATGATT